MKWEGVRVGKFTKWGKVKNYKEIRNKGVYVKQRNTKIKNKREIKH